MPAVSETVHVRGLRELQRACKAADGTLRKELRTTLRDVAEPVRADAETLAVADISRIGLPWSRMRVGITTTSVYVAPRQRGRLSRSNPRLKRPNLAGLLLGKAMEPALEKNEQVVVAGLERMLDDVGRTWGRP